MKKIVITILITLAVIALIVLVVGDMLMNSLIGK